MDMLLKIRETPWGHLGTRFESQPKSVYDIVPKTEYTWQVSYLPMKTDIHDSIKNYNYKQLDKSYDIGYRIKKLPSLQVEKGISDVGIPYINSLVA